MGGKNHQPCRIYLANSTVLSRYLSLARAELEFANVSLEDVLLSELQSRASNADQITQHLQASLDALEGSLKTVADLRDQMSVNHYEELPPFRVLDLISLGHSFTNMGLVSLPSWDRVVETRRRHGFQGLLTYFEGRINHICDLTKALMERVVVATRSGELTPILEENRPENFRVDFARLYTTHLGFESDFLASSLLSTEIWYSFIGRGSLSSQTALRRTA